MRGVGRWGSGIRGVTTSLPPASPTPDPEVIALLTKDTQEDDLHTPPFGGDDAATLLIPERDAKRLYLLETSALAGVAVAKEKSVPNADLQKERKASRDGSPDVLRLYSLAEVEAAALVLHGSESEMVRKRRALWKLAQKAAGYARSVGERRFGAGSGSRPAVRGAQGEGGEYEPGTKAVYTAIATNSLIMASKGVAYLFSGSPSLLAETVHSAADVGNQSLLALGIARSKQESDETHPYGYGRDRFVWSMISGVGIFFLGAGASVWHGIHGLFHPGHVESYSIALGVLGVSFALESYSSAVAVSEIKKEAAKSNMAFVDYIKNGSDPMNTAVLLEDGAALVGVGIAASAIGLSAYTGNPMYDALGSLAVGGILAGVATFLIQKNRAALLGKSIPPDQLRDIRRVLENDPMVHSVHGLRAITIGANSVRLSADINVDANALAASAWPSPPDETLAELKAIGSPEELHLWQKSASLQLVGQLGDEVDRLERLVVSVYPEVRYIELEVV